MHRFPSTRFLLALLGAVLPSLTIAAEDGSTAEPIRKTASTEFTDPLRYLDLFEPLTTEEASLSPDGERVAVSYREGEELWVMIASLEEPREILTRMLVATDRAATPFLAQQLRERYPANIVWMGWATDDRLVIHTNRASTDAIDGEWHQRSGEILSVEADGSEWEIIATPTTLRRTRVNAPASSPHSVHSPSIPIPPMPDTYRRSYGDNWGYGSRWRDRHPRDASMQWLDEMRWMDHHLDKWQHQSPQQPGLVSYPAAEIEVLDFHPERPGEILVRAGTKNDFDLYSIDATTGRKRIVETERVDEGKAVLLDRQYRANLAIPNSTRTSFPHKYKYDQPHGFTFWRWKDLENYVDETAAEKTDFTLSPENVTGRRSIPLGFDEDPDILYFASDIGRDTFGVYALDLSTGKPTDFAIEHPDFDLIPRSLHGFTPSENLIYDRYSRELIGVRFTAQYRTAAWVSPDWQNLQRLLEKQFPHASVDVLEWDRDAERFLVSVESPADPGGFYVYDAPTNAIMDIAPRAPVVETESTWTAHIEVRAPSGRDIHCRLTVPSHPIHRPAPVVVLYAENVWDRLSVDFDPEAVALARMGYVVLQVNGRGSWGYGRDTRTAFAQGHAQAQAEEITALVDYLEEFLAIHPEKIAVMGEGMGGYLALRTLQEQGEHFRCAVAINAPFNLSSWIAKARWGGAADAAASDLQLLGGYIGENEAEESAVLASRHKIDKPVLLFAFQGNDGGKIAPDYNEAFTLAHHLRNRQVPVELRSLHRDYMRDLPRARAEVFAHIAGFLNTHMFDYDAEPRDFESYLDEESEESMNWFLDSAQASD